VEFESIRKMLGGRLTSGEIGASHPRKRATEPDTSSTPQMCIPAFGLGVEGAGV